MNRCVFIYLFCVLVAGDGAVLTIDGEDYSLQQFYAHYPKKQWADADSSRKHKVYTDFVRRELCILEAKKRGLMSDPSVAVKIRDRSHQLLVNESYEQLVALPLIDPKNIEEARKFARFEVFVNHILVGYSGAYLSRPPDRSLDDALLLAQDIKKQFSDGADFSGLAEKYSDDPSVGQNIGIVGWVHWGATVPAFQAAAFGLEEQLLSDPVLTAFGYHLILVTDRRPSDYNYMSDEEYESAIMGLSMVSVRDKLRVAAIAYDSLQIDKHGVYFNTEAVLEIVSAYLLKQKQASVGKVGNINVADFLESLSGVDVICVYGGGGFGPRWFANKIRGVPSSKQPVLSSEDVILSVFKTIILQDVAQKNGYLFGVDDSFSFRFRRDLLVSGVLYDAYLKYLVGGAPPPDSSDVLQYYNKNMEEKYMAPGSVLIREIRVATRNLADSLLVLLDTGVGFDLLAREHSLVNPGGGGRGEPFSRNKNRSFFDAASLLGAGKISRVLASPGGLFSIVLLEKKIPGKPLDFSRVYSRIESLLIKTSRDAAKKRGVDGLFDKYNVISHRGLLD